MAGGGKKPAPPPPWHSYKVFRFALWVGMFYIGVLITLTMLQNAGVNVTGILNRAAGVVNSTLAPSQPPVSQNAGQSTGKATGRLCTHTPGVPYRCDSSSTGWCVCPE